MAELNPWLVVAFPAVAIAFALLFGLMKMFSGIASGSVTSTTTAAGILAIAGLGPTLFLDPSNTDITVAALLILMVLLAIMFRALGSFAFFALGLAALYIARDMGFVIPDGLSGFLNGLEAYLDADDFTLSGFRDDLPDLVEGWVMSFGDLAEYCVDWVRPLVDEVFNRVTQIDPNDIIEAPGSSE